MADHTKIEWADATANYVNGCSVVSPGCTNCYAMRLAGTRMKHHPTRIGLTTETKAGPVWNGTVRLHEPVLHQVLRWKRPRRIFWNAHGDLFHEAVPDAAIDRQFAVMALTPQHQHIVLTKRSARMREYVCRLTDANEQWERLGDAAAVMVGNVGYTSAGERQWPLPNVWLGVSVEDQARADERIPDLLATPAAVRWISAEPLLGPVDLTRVKEADAEECWTKHDAQSSLNALTGHYWGEDFVQDRWMPWVGEDQPSPGFGEEGYFRPLDWVVCGGESGPGARPMHPDWARSLRDQCAAAGVPFFFKQWGGWSPLESASPAEPGEPGMIAWPDGSVGMGLLRPKGDRGQRMYLSTKTGAGHLLDGAEHLAMPLVWEPRA